MPRGSKPGERRGGRQKGVPNKLSGAAKENMAEAYRLIGGTKAFAEWAASNLTDFYKLYARLLPVEGAGDEGEHVHKIIHEVVRPK